MSQPAAQPLTFRTRAEMSPEYFETVSKMLGSQAYRELAAAVVFAEALALVPTLEFKRHVVHTVEEEMEHYAICVRLAEDLGIEGFDAACSQRVREDRSVEPKGVGLPALALVAVGPASRQPPTVGHRA